jgi:hypothetical protein
MNYHEFALPLYFIVGACEEPSAPFPNPAGGVEAPATVRDLYDLEFLNRARLFKAGIMCA